MVHWASITSVGIAAMCSMLWKGGPADRGNADIQFTVSESPAAAVEELSSVTGRPLFSNDVGCSPGECEHAATRSAEPMKHLDNAVSFHLASVFALAMTGDLTIVLAVILSALAIHMRSKLSKKEFQKGYSAWLATLSKVVADCDSHQHVARKHSDTSALGKETLTYLNAKFKNVVVTSDWAATQASETKLAATDVVLVCNAEQCKGPEACGEQLTQEPEPEEIRHACDSADPCLKPVFQPSEFETELHVPPLAQEDSCSDKCWNSIDVASERQRILMGEGEWASPALKGEFKEHDQITAISESDGVMMVYEAQRKEINLPSERECISTVASALLLTGPSNGLTKHDHVLSGLAGNSVQIQDVVQQSELAPALEREHIATDEGGMLSSTLRGETEECDQTFSIVADQTDKMQAEVQSDSEDEDEDDNGLMEIVRLRLQYVSLLFSKLKDDMDEQDKVHPKDMSLTSSWEPVLPTVEESHEDCDQSMSSSTAEIIQFPSDMRPKDTVERVGELLPSSVEEEVEELQENCMALAAERERISTADSEWLLSALKEEIEERDQTISSLANDIDNLQAEVDLKEMVLLAEREQTCMPGDEALLSVLKEEIEERDQTISDLANDVDNLRDEMQQKDQLFIRLREELANSQSQSEEKSRRMQDLERCAERVREEANRKIAELRAVIHGLESKDEKRQHGGPIQQRRLNVAGKVRESKDQSFTLHFAELDFHSTNHEAFKGDLLNQFRACGMPEVAISRLRVQLREGGSTTVEISGNSFVIQELRNKISRSNFEVMGSVATVADVQNDGFLPADAAVICDMAVFDDELEVVDVVDANFFAQKKD